MSDSTQASPSIRLASTDDIPALARMAGEFRDHNRKNQSTDAQFPAGVEGQRAPAGISAAQIKTIESYDACAEAYDGRIGALLNYNKTYDELVACVQPGARILDLACGPANISRYIAARKNIAVTCIDLSEQMLGLAGKHLPDARLLRQSIIDFTDSGTFDAVVNGFGLPYLDEKQCERCIQSSAAVLAPEGWLYLSFMKGDGARLQKTSFGGDLEFTIYHHPEEIIFKQVEAAGLQITHRWNLDYQEADGSISTDVVLLSRKP